MALSLIQKIKLLLKLETFEKDVEKEAFAMNNGKPGWKTSEFWLMVMTQAAAIWGSMQGFVPPKYAVIVNTVGPAVYTIARTLLKAN